MIKNKVLVIFSVIVLMSIGILNNSAVASPTLQYGNTNGDVWDLQYRLKVLGYYTQPLDGKYGAQTTSAVYSFQKEYGITPDGIAGNQTWNVLKKFSLNLKEMDMMAKVIYSEARGEPYIGQVAVGAVVMNRIQSNQFPDSIKDVVFQPRAFTAVDDGQYRLTPNRTAYLAAMDAVRGWDPTDNSLYYFNPDTATSKWIWSRPQNLKIGKHIFAG